MAWEGGYYVRIQRLSPGLTPSLALCALYVSCKHEGCTDAQPWLDSTLGRQHGQADAARWGRVHSQASNAASPANESSATALAYAMWHMAHGLLMPGRLKKFSERRCVGLAKALRQIGMCPDTTWGWMTCSAVSSSCSVVLGNPSAGRNHVCQL